MSLAARFALVVFSGSDCLTAARQLSSSIAIACRLTKIEVLDGGVNDYLPNKEAIHE